MPEVHIIDLHFLDVEQTIASFLLESSEGPILVETGPHSRIADLERGLSAKGYTTADVQHVFLTHIHLDHAGAAWYFAEQGANVYLHPVGMPHMADPSRLMASAKRIYQDQMNRLWGQMNAIPKAQLIPIDHGQHITVGDLELIAHHTPGHAVHHIAWQIGDELIGGDVTGVRIDGGLVVPPCPPPDIHIEDWKASIALIRKLNVKKIYLTHFGAIDGVEEHLDQLEAQLDSWSNWMRPFAERQTDPKEVVPLFEAFVRRQLLAAGLDEKGIRQYESANPAWMSVAGLMRYWKKQLAPK
ncbi:MAG: MBL fold metallo-hydrolase [Bacteroidota bacterium]